MKRYQAHAAFITLALLVHGPAGESQDAAAIDTVKRLSVAVLDPALPPEPFERWLLRVLNGAAGQIAWEVNDCGEQTGDPAVDRARDLPICVEACARVRSVRGADADIVVQVAVGTERTGIRGTPSVRWIYIEEGATLGEVPALAELKEAIAALREGPSPYYRRGLAAAVSACCAGLRLPGGGDMREPWSLQTHNMAVEGDFNGDGELDAAVLLIEAGAGGGPTLAVFHSGDGRYHLVHRQKVDRLDDVVIERPQDAVLRVVRRGEEWAPEGGDVPRSYPHSFDAIELSSHKIAAGGGVDTRLRLIHWTGSRYAMY